ncbi:helix-turn-helix domain-containing protein [Microbacterium paraoxydans]|uniref:helix-turn-helix domain-containing protein n=1 Tax=Microbacterium paraoxydans TaxID=199592 RepID=UPI0012F828A8|nr:helix-turn-helix domain-containing protein [Microbacterium paraoxydans]
MIAQRMGVANSTISTIRREKLKLPRLSPKVARAHEESPRAARQRRIVELHGQGMTDQQIADELGTTRSAVYQARVRLNLPLNRARTRGPYKPARPQGRSGWNSPPTRTSHMAPLTATRPDAAVADARAPRHAPKRC